MIPTNSPAAGSSACPRPDLFEQLGRPLDGAERVLDLVRQAGRHRAERGKAVALFHSRVDAAVDDDDANLGGHRLEQRDLFGRERVADTVVGHEEERRRSPLLLRRERRARPRSEGPERLCRRLARRRRRSLASRAISSSESDPSFSRRSRAGGPRGPRRAWARPRRSDADEVEAVAVLVAEVKRRGRDAVRPIEPAACAS